MNRLSLLPKDFILRMILLAVFCLLFYISLFLFIKTTKALQVSNETTAMMTKQSQLLSLRVASSEAHIRKLESEDERVRNNKLQKEPDLIKSSYQQSVTLYESMLKLRDDKVKTTHLESLFAQVLTYLANLNYASASAQLAQLEQEVRKLQTPVSGAAVAIFASTPPNNTPPGSGYSQQVVEANGNRFLIDIIAADLSSTKVVVETASTGDCADNCPVDSLSSYVAKAGGYAGINGPYFCPESYPSCANKKNSFDTLLMNRNKTYFNSENNVYSSVPAAIFGSGYARFIGASSEWGRDTSPDSVVASQPLLLSGGEIRFGGDDEVKRSSRGSRSFIASKGNVVYIGVVHNANVAEVALVLKAMGIENALNLDSGGSTALYASGRYIAGPGRNTPFGIVFATR